MISFPVFLLIKLFSVEKNLSAMRYLKGDEPVLGKGCVVSCNHFFITGFVSFPLYRN